MLNRRAALLAIAASGFATAAARAASSEVLRVVGTVTPENYSGLEAFLFNSFDTVVGLRLSFEASEDGEDGTVAASAEGEQFVAYLRGGGESEIVANEGYSFQHGAFVFEGFAVVKSGGMNQGVISIFLERADEASVLLSNAPVKDVDIDRLRADIRKQ